MGQRYGRMPKIGMPHPNYVDMADRGGDAHVLVPCVNSETFKPLANGRSSKRSMELTQVQQIEFTHARIRALAFCFREFSISFS